MSKKTFKRRVVLYDGDCGFCIRWARYWKNKLTWAKVYFYSYQKNIHHFPELKKSDCEAGLQLIEPSGRIYSGAQAVFKLLEEFDVFHFFSFLYKKSNLFASISEKIYTIVAKKRKLFGRWFNPPYFKSYQLSTTAFRILLGGIYMIAFYSLSQQVLGLYGQGGILPIQDFVQLIQQNFATDKYLKFPSLFWLSASNQSLQLVCLVGMLAGLLMTLNFFTRLNGFIAWVCYLSFVSLGRDFMSFQWDILLLEVGFLALFVFRYQCSVKGEKITVSSPQVRFLFALLLFRLMFLSGYVKLASGDEVWRNLEAMFYHYQTQPLPTPLSPFFHFLPPSIHKLSVVLVFFIELILPFFIFGTRRMKRLTAVFFISFQILIMLTGNYTFFNLLTIALCFVLIDDQWLHSLKLKGVLQSFSQIEKGRHDFRIYHWVKRCFFILFIGLNVLVMMRALDVSRPWSRSLATKIQFLRPFHLVNTYGLFAVMTTKRLEIDVEASLDGAEWKSYEFKYKPGDTTRALKWVAPLQPRLDWQMWFAALSNVYQNPWFIRFLDRLVQKDRYVVDLLESLPFEEKPTYIRAMLYEYEFVNVYWGKTYGNIWKRKLVGSYLRKVKII